MPNWICERRLECRYKHRELPRPKTRGAAGGRGLGPDQEALTCSMVDGRFSVGDGGDGRIPLPHLIASLSPGEQNSAGIDRSFVDEGLCGDRVQLGLDLVGNK